MKLIKSHMTMRFSLRQLFLLGASFLFVTLFYKPYVGSVINTAIEVVATEPDVRHQHATESSVNSKCNPANKVAFMKTHKCASSTIENIMFRHALRGDLNVAIPQNGNYLSETELFDRRSVTNATWGALPMDVFTLHNRWNYNEVVALMGAATRTFSAVRDPVDQFASLYVYMKMADWYRTDLKGFVKLLRNNRKFVERKPRRYRRFGRNQIAFDWGYPPSAFNSKDKKHATKFIEKMDKQFGMVVVAERMEESLVLLADYLCWPLEYVTHLDLNVRKPERVIHLSDAERQTLRDWLNVDSVIYDYFSRRLDERIKVYNNASGAMMGEQVKRLRALNSELHERCVVARVGNDKLSGKFRETNDDTLGYMINPERPDCDPYAMSEPAFLKLFREKMTDKVLATQEAPAKDPAMTTSKGESP